MAEPGFKPNSILKFRVGQEYNLTVAFSHCLTGPQRRKVATAELDRQMSLTYLPLDPSIVTRASGARYKKWIQVPFNEERKHWVKGRNPGSLTRSSGWRQALLAGYLLSEHFS